MHSAPAAPTPPYNRRSTFQPGTGMNDILIGKNGTPSAGLDLRSSDRLGMIAGGRR
jgi:hypothetical protein